MTYAVAITSTGQMTLPKALRIFLGVDGAKTITLEKHKDTVVIRKKQSYDEFRAEMDKHISVKAKRLIDAEEKNGGRPPVRSIMKRLAKTPKNERRLKEKYGL